MEKEIKRKSYFCDVCAQEIGYKSNCICCNKDYCYKCQKEYCVALKYSVHCGGSGDHLLCLKCDQSPAKYVPLINAYRRVSSLRREEAAWYEDFRKRCDAAEADVKKYLKQYSL